MVEKSGHAAVRLPSVLDGGNEAGGTVAFRCKAPRMASPQGAAAQECRSGAIEVTTCRGGNDMRIGTRGIRSRLSVGGPLL